LTVRRDPKAFAGELGRTVRERSVQDRRMLFVGILNRYMPEGREAVLVGGALVEFYTKGGYVTGDVDLVGDRDSILPLLTAAGFERQARVFIQEDLGLVVDIADDTLRRGESVEHIEFEGYRVPAVTLEDAIVDRLLAAKLWKSTTDWEQAILLFTAHRETIDRAVLRGKARANEVEDFLRKLIARTPKGQPPRQRT
jgi:predicted nucleotidyltransferase